MFFNLRGKKKGLEWFTEEEIEQVAKDLGVKVSELAVEDDTPKAPATEKKSDAKKTTAKK